MLLKIRQLAGDSRAWARAITFLSILFAPILVLAATGYVPLESSVTGGQNVSNFGDYLKRVYEIGITITITLAVLYLVIGGFGYITSSASLTKKEDSKNMINNALFGLVLALLSYVILNTISPQFTQFSLNISEVGKEFNKTPEKTASGDGSLFSLPDRELTQRELALREELVKAGIGINYGSCPPNRTIGCTDVGGLPLEIVGSLKGLMDSCGAGCDVVITGGSEGGHKTHGEGRPVVDLRKGSFLTDYIVRNSKTVTETSKGKLYVVDGVKYLDEGDHFHADFSAKIKK